MSDKKKLSALDRSFLGFEGRDVMMHVGGLLEFSRTREAQTDLVENLREELKQDLEVVRPFNLRLNHPDMLTNPLQSWVPDPSFDIEYHVRRSALPSPGDERELGILVSRLHGTPLDFHRPPWEAHFIEGLEKKRFAIYFKVHHSLIDGYTGMRLLAQSLSAKADETDAPLFFSMKAAEREKRVREESVPTLAALLGAMREQVSVAKDIGRAVMSAVRSRKDEERTLALPMQAPKSILNQRISRSRRFATHHASLHRLKAIAGVSGGTLNDVILAICGIALRRFLLEQNELPDKPLVAMVPVNVRPKDDPGGGNAVGAILATLATNEKSPKVCLETIIASTKRAKAQLSGMSKNAIMQYSGLVLAPLMLAFVPQAAGRVRPAFNVVISNVPGPDHPLYFRGWRLDEMYPLSIPFHGYGLNITVQSYAGSLNFGFTGCRDTLPHLQHLAIYSGDAIDALERAYELSRSSVKESRQSSRSLG
jgi:diacylglycerol O-acyltransferase / wax synthase